MKVCRVYACLMRLHFNAVFGKTVLVAIFSLGNITLPAQHLVINNVDEEPFKEFVLDYDPSTVAISNDHPNAWSPKLYFERWRIITDLNNDGIRLIRNDAGAKTNICGKSSPTDEEKKIIHQVENKFNIRFISSPRAGSYI